VHRFSPWLRTGHTMADRLIEPGDTPATSGGQGGETRPSRGGTPRWEGMDGVELAALLDVPRVAVHGAVGSTMDAAHLLAGEGAPAGTIVIADQQTSGRGRGGHTWVSPPGSGIWMTIIERPTDPAAVELWSVRHGIHAARALDEYAGQIVGIKWPNDLYVGHRKLAGILIEARWQERHLLWVAVGIGINVRETPAVRTSGSLELTADRVAVLQAVVSALRAAAQLSGALSPDELRECKARDIALGRACSQPAVGQVLGIGTHGELRVQTPDGVQAFRTGSLVFDQYTEVV
jgi:BirA family transcriptional regulator, biotin operon repressor / biotin---[acetyl-CoA-carboxylase] ligase